MKKILVVDDSDVNLFLIQTIFEDDPDIEIVLENDSTKTIQDIKRHNPNLIVLDLMMPFVDGFTLLHEIKADPGMKEIEIIVISAFLNDEAIDKVKNFGVVDFLHKPILLDEAESKIKSLLGLK